jgi:hypothetical protein
MRRSQAVHWNIKTASYHGYELEISAYTDPGSQASVRPAKPGSTWSLILTTIGVFAVWLFVTKLFWVGYAGSDDLFYSRYAFLFHRMPINWWESRMPAILAIRTAFWFLDPTEFAAALPTLVASLASLAAIAWYAGWPNHLSWRTAATALLAATLPLSVTYQTVPGAIFVASGLMIVGSVCILRGSLSASVFGSVCFALAIATHESSCFYIGIFLCTAALFDRRRFVTPLLISVAFSLTAVAIECAVYAIKYGDPLLRFHLVLGESAGHSGLFDPDTHLTGLRFLTWPLQTLIFSKAFGPDLLLLLCLGVAVWRKLSVNQRILLVSGLFTWFYLGYGSKVPWDYRPMARMYHFYGPLCLSVAVLLPVCLGHVFSRTARPVIYAAISTAALVVAHLLCCAAGGKWGQPVAVSRELLSYAVNHRDSTFVTDVATMNHMYVLNGFRIPANVVCINGEGVARDLLLNKEPPETPRVSFPVRQADGILVNLDQLDTGVVDREFLAYLGEHPGPHELVAPVRYRLLFEKLPAKVRNRDFALKSLGGECIRLR